MAIETIEVQIPGIQGPAWMQDSPTGGYKNKLINGEVTRINQRGFDGDWSALSAGDYGYDRWKKHANGIEQIIESGNMIPDTYIISWTGGGTGYVDDVAVVSGDTFIQSDTSQVSIVVPEDATYVQVERGTTITLFEQRHIGQELALCQRYYISAADQSVLLYITHDCQNIRGFAEFPVEMREIPSITLMSPLTGAVNYATLYTNGLAPADWQQGAGVFYCVYITKKSMNVGSSYSYTMGNDEWLFIGYTADAEL